MIANGERDGDTTWMRQVTPAYLTSLLTAWENTIAVEAEKAGKIGKAAKHQFKDGSQSFYGMYKDTNGERKFTGSKAAKIERVRELMDIESIKDLRCKEVSGQTNNEQGSDAEKSDTGNDEGCESGRATSSDRYDATVLQDGAQPYSGSM